MRAMVFPRWFSVLVLPAGLWVSSSLGQAQSWDSAGNALLSGTYYFREVVIAASSAVSVYGNIAFNGNGGYTISALGYQCTSSGCGQGNFQTTGSYAIGANGYAAISNQLTGGSIFALLGANNVLVGSSTETGYLDLFVAAPVSGQGTSTLSGPYSLSYVSPTGQVPLGALLTMNANGAGNIGNVNVTEYDVSATPGTQTISGVKYFVSNNAFVVQFPNSNTNLITGNEYLYSTPDGSFVFGGSPVDFDFIVGVKTSGQSAPISGLYAEAGMEIDNTGLLAGSYSGVTTYYGALQASNGTIVAHQRIQDGTGAAGYGYVYRESYPAATGSGNYILAARSRQFITAGGVRIGVGIGPYPGLSVAVPAVVPKQQGAVYLNPAGIVNAASGAPFTAGLSPGELIVLNGTGIGPPKFSVAATTPIPASLAGVQVSINGTPAPVVDASAAQVTALVPFLTPSSSVAPVQVFYNGVGSNIVTLPVNQTTPGVFVSADGSGRAIARHSNGALVDPLNPAKGGETISVLLTGLGVVSPSVVDGAVGPSVRPAVAAGIGVYVGGVQAATSFIGLAPGLPALYQIKLAIPAVTAAGDVKLEITSADAYTSQAIVAVAPGTNGSGSEAPATRSRGPKRPLFQAPHPR